MQSNANYERVLAAEAAGRARIVGARAPLVGRVAAKLNEIVAAKGGAEMDDLELAFPDEIDRLTPELIAEAKRLAGKLARSH